MAKILFAGDYCPTLSNIDSLSTNTGRQCIGQELFDLFMNQDFSVINLETTLTDKETPKMKRGQINTSAPETCHFLKEIGVKLCCMANNHSIDNGNIGLENTMLTLDRYGISYIGAGKTKEEAEKPYKICFDKDNTKIRILNYSNFEFNNICNGEYGTNIYDPLDTFDDIRKQKQEGEILIVVYHGGVEYYQYPSPMLQRICRKMVDCGADIVLCQHSHCIGAYEHYKSAFIMYGQGNFLFDDTDNELEKCGVLIELDTCTKEITVIPITKEGSLVRASSAKEREIILQDLETRSSLITDRDKTVQLFEDFALSQNMESINALAGYYLPFRVLNKITKNWFSKQVYTPKAIMRLYNIINSPALFEVLNEDLSHYE